MARWRRTASPGRRPAPMEVAIRKVIASSSVVRRGRSGEAGVEGDGGGVDAEGIGRRWSAKISFLERWVMARLALTRSSRCACCGGRADERSEGTSGWRKGRARRGLAYRLVELLAVVLEECADGGRAVRRGFRHHHGLGLGGGVLADRCRLGWKDTDKEHWRKRGAALSMCRLLIGCELLKSSNQNHVDPLNAPSSVKVLKLEKSKQFIKFKSKRN